MITIEKMILIGVTMNNKNKLNIDLYLTDDETKESVIITTNPDLIVGYNECTLTDLGKQTIIRLTYNYNEWAINLDTRKVIHMMQHHLNGMIERSYTFERLIIN